jgi:hypothetical protein
LTLILGAAGNRVDEKAQPERMRNKHRLWTNLFISQLQ